MGCGSSKEQSTASNPKANQKSTKPPPVPKEDPKAKWEDASKMNDPDLDAELNAKRINKAGKEVDPYDRNDARPEDNAAMGMFQMESAGAGDQALATKPCAGAIIAPESAPAVENGEPNLNLQLEYIYGYRCFDTRQNVFITTSGDIAYMAAAVGIVLNTGSNEQKFFGAGNVKEAHGHSDDITALAIHPDRTLVATGEVGKNPKIIVWNTSTMEIVKSFRQGRGSRSVTALAFSKDGNLLASCAYDNDHTVRVWDWNAENATKTEAGGPDKILDCAFSPTEDTLCTVGIKHIYFWFGAEGYDKKRGIFGSAGKMCDMTTVQFLANGKAVTGGTNGAIYLWDRNNCERSIDIHAGNAANHTLRIVDGKILAGGSDKKLHVLNEELKNQTSHDLPDTPRAVDMVGERIIVGCRDGSIVELNAGQKKTVMESHSDGEVWGLAVSTESPNIIVSAGDDNKLKVWDISQKKCIATATINQKGGPKNKPGHGASTMARTSPNQQARCIAINKTNGNVAVGLNDGKWQVRKGVTQIEQQIHEGKQGPGEWIEAMRYSPDGKWLAIGSHDNGVYIFNTSNYQQTGKGMKHSSFITALDWSKDSKAIKTTSGDYELLFWTVDDNGKIEQNTSGASELKDETWETYSTPFGWHVQGVFGGVVDYTHVNRVDRDPDERLVAVGNDWGLVEVFNFPNGEGAKSQQFRGHSEHVTNVKWSADYVFSAGGYDQCIMQWRKA